MRDRSPHFPDLSPVLEDIHRGCCRRYREVRDRRGLVEEHLLPVERILTLPMDRAAREEGYGIRET